MPRQTVTNAALMDELVALQRQIQQRDEPLEGQLNDLGLMLNDLARRVDAMEKTLVQSMAKEAKRDACPFRDEIVLAANNRARISALEAQMKHVEIQIAKWSALGGAIVSGVMTLAARMIEGLQGGR